MRERWHGRAAGEAAAGCRVVGDGGMLVLGWRSQILGLHWVSLLHILGRVGVRGSRVSILWGVPAAAAW